MTNNTSIQLVGIDLDGTLLSNDKTISDADLHSLDRLGEKRAIRVAATGRNLFKVKEVLPAGTPIDFVVFSSGGGIYDWKKQRLLQHECFEKPVIAELCKHLLLRKLNFFVYGPIPRNNKFYFHRGAGQCDEFENYLERHAGDFLPFNEHLFPDDAGQLMAIVPNDDQLFKSLENEIYSACSEVKVIRTTSPVNTKYLWLEIFPQTVSKGHGLKWLCDWLNIGYNQTLGIGNDYNDLDMFEFVAHPYVLGNGVRSLKEKYHSVEASNNESGVTAVLQLFPND